MKTQISKMALISAFGAALAFAPAMAQEATDAAAPAAPAEQAQTPAPAAEANGAVSVTGTVAAVEANGAYTVTVPTQSGSVRDIAVDASAAAAEGLAVGDQVTIVGTLDAEQTKLTASSITKAAAEGAAAPAEATSSEAAPSDAAAPAEQPAQ